jgi:hypothetical protein
MSSILKTKNVLSFEKIIGTDFQIGILYLILQRRCHNISNITIPKFTDHINFVRKNPYRVWYLLKKDTNYIGTAYVMYNNCVGINLISNFFLLPSVIEIILKKHKPLKEIKSIRPPFFFINVSPSNAKIKYQLKKIGANKIQSTYMLV